MAIALPEDPAHHLHDAAGVAVDQEGVAADPDPLVAWRRIGQVKVEEVAQEVLVAVPAARQKVAERPGPRVVAVGRAVAADAVALLSPEHRRQAPALPVLAALPMRRATAVPAAVAPALATTVATAVRPPVRVGGLVAVMLAGPAMLAGAGRGRPP